MAKSFVYTLFSLRRFFLDITNYVPNLIYHSFIYSAYQKGFRKTINDVVEDKNWEAYVHCRLKAWSLHKASLEDLPCITRSERVHLGLNLSISSL